MRKNLGNGNVLLGLTQDELEESISALEQLKIIMQNKLMELDFEGQGLEDAEECGKHLDTAITAMEMIYNVNAGADEGTRN